VIAFRPVTDADLPFLRELYATTREAEMAVVPWSPEEKAAFVGMQFEAQHTYYVDQFPNAQFDLVLEDGAPIGRLYVDRRDDEHRLIDIALLPTCRNRGIGGRLMRDVLNEAAAAGKKVRIHVEEYNPAMHLYDRLGFEKLEEQGPYWLMEWRPESLNEAAVRTTGGAEP
jgi:ribosomal protein S18 acetylase RimI-like enzyme